MKKGFTLLELAIVLIIIGILVGGLIKSADIIKNSKAKKTVTDLIVLADAQYRYYETTGRYAGDADNDGRIDFGGVTDNSYPDGTAADPDDMDYPFTELHKLGLNADAEITGGGPAFFAGITVSEGTARQVNVISVRNVPCMAAVQAETALDNASQENSAGTGSIRAVSPAGELISGSWDVLCPDTDARTDFVYILGAQ